MGFLTKKTLLNSLLFVLLSLRKSIKSKRLMNFKNETDEELWAKKLGKRNKRRSKEKKNENKRDSNQEERVQRRKEKEAKETNL